MPYTAEHKQQSREKILQSAVSLFSNQGFENTSIDEIMQDADMTRGAFYAHFSSKSDLYQHALITGALNSPLLWSRPDDFSDQKWMNVLVKGYLSEQHIEQDKPPCPLAFLVTDVAVSEPEVRHTYTEIFKRMNKLMRKMARPYSECSEQDIYAILAMMIGSVAIGRCLDSDSVRTKMLKASENLARAILNGEMEIPKTRQN